MASVMKYTNCLLIFLCLSSVWLSYAQAPQDGNATTEITAILKAQKEFMVTAATTSAPDNNGIKEGRKMALHKVMRRAAAQALSGGNSNKVLACPNNQVRENFARKKKRGHQKENCKEAVGHSSVEIDETAGFVAFNADYRAPRHHPPKNN